MVDTTDGAKVVLSGATKAEDEEDEEDEEEDDTFGDDAVVFSSCWSLYCL